MTEQIPIDTTVIVPCYNEAERLDVARFRAFAASEPPVRLRFVDDGSTDDTKGVLESLCAADPARLEWMSLARNAGKAEAVRAGVNHTLEADKANGPPAYFGYWDADLATALEEIHAFRRVLVEREEVVGVLGSRVRLLGRHIERRPMRHYLGRTFATVASLVLGLAVYDTQCGAKLFRRTAAKSISIIHERPAIRSPGSPATTAGVKLYSREHLFYSWIRSRNDGSGASAPITDGLFRVCLGKR